MTEDGGWQCARCLLQNEARTERCGLCDAGRNGVEDGPSIRLKTPKKHSMPDRRLQGAQKEIIRITRSRLLPKAYCGEAEVCDLRRSSTSEKNRSRSESWRVMTTTFNVGNRRVNDKQMNEWLGACANDAEVIAVALQEANYLSSSQKRGLTVLGASALALSAGMPMTAAVAGAAVGAMAVHSHLMPRIREARGRRRAAKEERNSSSSPATATATANQDAEVAQVIPRDGSVVSSSEDEDDDSDIEDEDFFETSPQTTNFRIKGYEGTPMFSLAIASAIDRQLEPRGFSRAAFVEYGQLRLLVYHHHSVKVESSKQAKHGIGKFFNKGGLATRLRLLSPKKSALDISFLAAHLPAHENKRQQRTDALNEIWTAVGPTIDGADITILCGDLNYRLAPPVPLNAEDTAVLPEAPKAEVKSRIRWNPTYTQKRSTSPPSMLTHAAVCSLIEAGKLDSLHQKDELNHELAQSTVFAGFVTPSCDFAPTFKLHRNKTRSYNEKRIPAWCDRVLFKARGGHSVNRVDILNYDSHEIVTSSDHKPVTLALGIVKSDDLSLRRRTRNSLHGRSPLRSLSPPPLSRHDDDDDALFERTTLMRRSSSHELLSIKQVTDQAEAELSLI